LHSKYADAKAMDDDIGAALQGIAYAEIEQETEATRAAREAALAAYARLFSATV
jgi:hypothetical protein